MNERIVLIGAGSAVFTRGLVADLIRLGIKADLALVDIDPHALRVAESLTRKMVDAKKAPLTVRASLDRRDVLKGATAVICTVGVGGRRARDVLELATGVRFFNYSNSVAYDLLAAHPMHLPEFQRS